MLIHMPRLEWLLRCLWYGIFVKNHPGTHSWMKLTFSWHVWTLRSCSWLFSCTIWMFYAFVPHSPYWVVKSEFRCILPDEEKSTRFNLPIGRPSLSRSKVIDTKWHNLCESIQMSHLNCMFYTNVSLCSTKKFFLLSLCLPGTVPSDTCQGMGQKVI